MEKKKYFVDFTSLNSWNTKTKFNPFTKRYLRFISTTLKLSSKQFQIVLYKNSASLHKYLKPINLIALKKLDTDLWVQIFYFPVWLQIRLLNRGLLRVLSYTEK